MFQPKMQKLSQKQDWVLYISFESDRVSDSGRSALSQPWNKRTWVCSIFVTVTCLSRHGEGGHRDQAPGGWTPAHHRGNQHFWSAFGWECPGQTRRALLRQTPQRWVSMGVGGSFRGSAELQGQEKNWCWAGDPLVLCPGLRVRGAGCLHCSDWWGVCSPWAAGTAGGAQGFWLHRSSCFRPRELQENVFYGQASSF